MFQWGLLLKTLSDCGAKKFVTAMAAMSILIGIAAFSFPGSVWGMDSMEAVQLQQPEDRIEIFVSKNCPPCERFFREVFTPSAQEKLIKGGWRIGGGIDCHFRFILVDDGSSTPRFDAYRNGNHVAEKTGYMTVSEFQEWSKNAFMEYYEKKKSDPVPPAPPAWPDEPQLNSTSKKDEQWGRGSLFTD